LCTHRTATPRITMRSLRTACVPHSLVFVLSVAHAAAIGVCIAHGAWYGVHRAHAAAHHVYVLYAVRSVLACGTLTTFSQACGPPPRSGPYRGSVRPVACVMRVSRTPRVPRGPVFFLMTFNRGKGNSAPFLDETDLERPQKELRVEDNTSMPICKETRLRTRAQTTFNLEDSVIPILDDASLRNSKPTQITLGPDGDTPVPILEGTIQRKLAQTTFNPDEDSSMPIPADSDPFPTAPLRPRPMVTVTPHVDTAGTKCADEIWLSPEWLEQVYHPRYEHNLPEGIVVPTVKTTTYELVVVNEEDDISSEQIKALRQLIARHPSLFNNGMGCVRVPKEDWLRLPVHKEYELKVPNRRPYKVSNEGEQAIDGTFDALTAHSRLEVPKWTSPWGLKVIVVYETDKDRPVIDMRLLNAALPGDSYPLPKVEDVIEPLGGMRWLGTVDITSAFYQRLLHPDDWCRTAVVTHRGVEQFTTSVMVGKTSVKHSSVLWTNDSSRSSHGDARAATSTTSYCTCLLSSVSSKLPTKSFAF
jgi:hypothetical protein